MLMIKVNCEQELRRQLGFVLGQLMLYALLLPQWNCYLQVSEFCESGLLCWYIIMCLWMSSGHGACITLSEMALLSYSPEKKLRGVTYTTPWDAK